MAETKPFYLATPYTKFAQGHETAFSHAASLAARLMKEGLPVYSPIAHSHPIARFYPDAVIDFQAWVDLDFWAIRNSAGLIVAQLPGWRDSFGVRQEINFAAEHGIPILYLDPVSLMASFHEREEDTCPEL